MAIIVSRPVIISRPAVISRPAYTPPPAARSVPSTPAVSAQPRSVPAPAIETPKTVNKTTTIIQQAPAPQSTFIPAMVGGAIGAGVVNSLNASESEERVHHDTDTATQNTQAPSTHTQSEPMFPASDAPAQAQSGFDGVVITLIIAAVMLFGVSMKTRKNRRSTFLRIAEIIAWIVIAICLITLALR